MTTDGGQRSIAHIPALDGLRGLAILMVVLHHLTARRNHDCFGSTLLSHIKSIGWIGVDMFFVLSGFLIGSILLRNYGTKHWLRHFIARRALRVLPLYFVVIFFCFNIATRIPTPQFDWLRKLQGDQWWFWLHLANFRRIWFDLAPAQANVHWMSTYWSLSIEEHFYLLWPCVLLLVGPKQLGRVAWLGVLLVMVTRAVLALGDLPISLVYYNTFTRMDGLLLGTLIGWLNTHRRNQLVRSGKTVATVFLVSLAAFTIPMAAGVIGGGRNTPYGGVVLYSASTAIAGSIVWFLVTQPSSHWICKVFSAPLLISFGKYSYAIYVFNKPVIYCTTAVTNGAFGRLSPLGVLVLWMFVCCLCWIVGWFSWRIIESPFLRLKRFFPVVRPDCQPADRVQPASAQPPPTRETANTRRSYRLRNDHPVESRLDPNPPL